MAGVRKKEGRIPPLLPQTSSSYSLSLSFPLSLPYRSFFRPLRRWCRRPRPVRVAAWDAAEQGGNRVVRTPDILSLLSSSLYPTPGSPFLSPTRSPIRDGSPALVLSLTLIALASAEWEKSQPPPKLRLRPGHARHPPSPLRLSLPLFLLPLSPLSTHLTLSPRPFFPTRVVVVAAEHHYRLAQAVVIARRRCHHPFPSLSAFPHSPAARPPPCPCPSLVPLPGTRPSGKGPQPSPSDGHAAALHRPFVIIIIIIIFSFLLSRYPPLSRSKPLSLPLHHSVYPYVSLFLEGFFFKNEKPWRRC